MQRALWTIRRFWHDTRAVLSVEAVLIFPLLIWGYAGFFTLYDSYRSKVLNIQAAYTVSDLLSRERNVIDDDYIAGLHNVYRQVTHARQTSFLRITVLQYDATNDDHILLWSRATPGFDDLTDATLHTIMDHVYIMADGASAIVVETAMGFTPLMNFRVAPFFFKHTVVTRPRFAPQLLYAPPV